MSARLYLSIEPLPAAYRPAVVERYAGGVLAVVDPSTLCAELIDWCCDNLSRDERNEYRSALGLPPVGKRVPDYVLDVPFAEVVQVPARMRLPGRPLTGADRGGTKRDAEIHQLRQVWAAS